KWSIRGKEPIQCRKTIEEAALFGVPVATAIRAPKILALHHPDGPSHQVCHVCEDLHRYPGRRSIRKVAEARRHIAHHLRCAIGKCGHDVPKDRARAIRTHTSA